LHFALWQSLPEFQHSQNNAHRAKYSLHLSKGTVGKGLKGHKGKGCFFIMRHKGKDRFLIMTICSRNTYKHYCNSLDPTHEAKFTTRNKDYVSEKQRILPISACPPNFVLWLQRLTRCLCFWSL
jgi:hypothetical protein